MRGRLGRDGFRGLSISSFLDLVWTEIWDDAPVMGDRAQHREIVHKLFIQGIPAWQITYKDHKGRLKHLSSKPDVNRPLPQSQRDAAKELFLKLGGKPKGAVESTPNG